MKLFSLFTRALAAPETRSQTPSATRLPSFSRSFSLMVLSLGLLGASGNALGQTELINEGLRDGSVPTGWTAVDIAPQTAAGGYARFEETTSTLTTPTFDASAHTSLEVDTSTAKWGQGDDGPITIEYSLDSGTTWTKAGDTSTPTGSTYIDDTTTINSLSATMQIRFSRPDSPSRKRFRDVVVNGIGTATSDPLITVTGSFGSLDTIQGDASNSTSVGITGANLTADISASAPAGFEVSNNDSTWGPSTTFVNSSGSASGDLYVRIADSAGVGAVSGDVTLTSTGADNVTVAVSGTVGLATPSTIAASSIGENSFTANWNAVSGADNYRLDVATDSSFSTGAGGGLFISEVADPDDDFEGRFVELYNATGQTIDFSSETYYLVRQANGGNTSEIQLTGTLADGETYVIGNASNVDGIYGANTTDLDFGSVTGNGDDGYFLYMDGGVSTGTLVDAYGVMDVDGTGENWEYEDSRAVRNAAITAPGTFDISEWTITAADVGDMNPGSHTVTGSTSGSLLASYNDLSVSGTSQSVTGLDADTTYYYRVRAEETANSLVSDNSDIRSVTTSSSATPDIEVTGSLGALTTTYGTASTADTVSVSGSDLTADITATAPSGFEVSSDGSTYGGTATFTQTGGTASGTLSVRIAADTAVGSRSGTVELTSAGATQEDVSIPTSTVNAKAIDITSVTAADKTYDTNTDASLSGGSLTGVESGDTVNFTLGTGTFASADVAAGISVSTSISLTGTDAGNYTLNQPSGLTADITALELTVGGSFTADDKTYDGTPDATIATDSLTLTGAVAGDDVTLDAVAAFADADVGTGKTVSLDGSSSLAGTESGNYTLSLTGAPTTTADITQATPTITSNPVASDIFEGDLLSDSSLTGGSADGVSGEITGTFAFTTPGTEPAAGTNPQSVTFDPASGNYSEVTVNVDVTVYDMTPAMTALEVDVTGDSLTLTFEVDGDVEEALIDFDVETASALDGTPTWTSAASQSLTNNNDGTATITADLPTGDLGFIRITTAESSP